MKPFDSKSSEIALSVSEFVALLNQTLEYAYPSVVVSGELANFRVSKGKWVYFDLKDEEASVRCFGTVYMLPGPLEDGMLLQVRAQPRLHPLYGFSLNIMNIRPAGEGSIRKAAELLQAKLAAEGLFAPERKRVLPYPPARIGLITSAESAAYADFTKIITARWSGLDIQLIDVQVQGEVAVGQIVAAIERFNYSSEPPEVLVLIRGGGSAEDLQAFSHELVTRAVAASRVPTLVAIGHEVDISLSELAADQRASTPSNAAELLVPDKRDVLRELAGTRTRLQHAVTALLRERVRILKQYRQDVSTLTKHRLERERAELGARRQLLTALSPQAVLKRGYAIVRAENGGLVRRARGLRGGEHVAVQFSDGRIDATIEGRKA